MNQFGINPEALRATRPHFDEVAAKVRSAVESLRRVIDAEGPCWGSDEPGRRFAEGYDGLAKHGDDNAGKLADLFSQLGDSMVAIANSSQSQDQASAAAIARLEL
ncbi:WXG100 family type VII secretion target [Nocardia terpenica]|uniref:WXG100 family type VII secretion target n=1 Tax=Nocardia terpenica TaxID=455432 RepID=A0A291RCW5_9NOCA|nr:hypothetical protein [Nocardia terpenica]ATL65165.1 hypothetical protein CRH09_01865 [Nocardia terpenica]